MSESANQSCDRARGIWFASARQGRDVPPFPTGDMIEAISEVREAARGEDRTSGEACLVASRIESYFGWPAFEGVITTVEGGPERLHAWNLLPGGAILDAAADLVGAGDVRISTSRDPEWATYRREWTASYNPDIEGLPELKGCAWSGKVDMDLILERRLAIGPIPGDGKAS